MTPFDLSNQHLEEKKNPVDVQNGHWRATRRDKRQISVASAGSQDGGSHKNADILEEV